ncbi:MULTISPECIES: GntR family transcriptional regulator [unclassified Micromonospora]|uniref:GntR family transcriptional regulator n=1 Tax=unclassified Micromonospora TaxID=2617518 RepID=UPI0033B24820
MTMEPDQLADLDPDDSRPQSQQIAGVLRAAILTGRLGPGDQLPSQPALAARYGVARETVKNALDVLRRERLILSRQGSGSYVRAQTERPVGLRPHIEAAFASPNVTIDFAGFSGETLHGAMQEPLDKIRAGRLAPESVTIRMLLVDLSVPTGVPSRAADGMDDPAVRARAERIVRRHAEAVAESVGELAALGLIRSARVEIRTQVTAPQFKLYVLNGVEAFFGFYPVVQHAVTIKEQQVSINDVMGKDATLFHVSIDDEGGALGAEYVSQAQTWFNSVWDNVARTYAL